ncbi:MAG TPA: polysaccharide deacetylase family protein [Bryobacteraceae bacterium]|jgi:peptidoglycan/xylan/chitin deacetylase (PgdA/CDA1 family)
MLHIVMYHYVRDLARTPYPRIKGMLLDDFERQVRTLASEFEMATLESALAYVGGRYRSRRELCLLTFDDGLKEHYREVTPILHKLGIEGIFHVITGCLEEQVVAPVHQNHFLMASLDFKEYREAFLRRLGELDPAACALADTVKPEAARQTYMWDTPEIADFKYFFNFTLNSLSADAVVREMFKYYIGSEHDFARELYVSWEEARAMQAAGMRIGGHTHRHRPLASLSAEDWQSDLEISTALLHRHLAPEQLWPFCYPYGKRASFPEEAPGWLKELGYACAFTTEKGPNRPGEAPFLLRRADCKQAPVAGGVEGAA